MDKITRLLIQQSTTIQNNKIKVKDFPYLCLIEQELRNYEDRYLKLGLNLTARSVIR